MEMYCYEKWYECGLPVCYDLTDLFSKYKTLQQYAPYQDASRWC